MKIRKLFNGQPIDEPIHEEIIAVIEAAVKAQMTFNSYNLKVRSFRRINNSNPVWSMASRKDQIDSRKMI